ncbi:MAG: hypothetical protein IKN70_05020 [Fibrobacter sp.]|nr:hypothetical protein [Fibrobacter sp.]
MKRIIVSLLLIASCAFAQNQTTPSSDPSYHTRRGFYFNANLGIIYTSTTMETTDTYENYTYEEMNNFSGFIPHDEIRLGLSIANIFSIYAALGFSYGTGSYEDKQKNTGDKYEEYTFQEAESHNDDIRFLFGLGGEFYPIQDKEKSFYGLFVGITAGFVIDNIYHTDHSFDDIYKDEIIGLPIGNFIFRFEVGRDWWFSKRWSFGVALNYTIGFMGEEYSYTKYEEEISESSHTIGLAVRMTH